MIDETDKMRLDFFRTQIGKTVSVLFETKTRDGFICGHTPNYTPVKVKSPHDFCGEIRDVKIISVSDDDFCIGELIL